MDEIELKPLGTAATPTNGVKPGPSEPTLPRELEGEGMAPEPHEIKVEDEEWFFGNIDRKVAESMCKVNGDYLVRYSTRVNKYVLTYCSNNEARHFVISQITENGQTKFQFGYEARSSIRELLEYHVTNAIPLTKDSGAVIRKFISRFGEQPLHPGEFTGNRLQDAGEMKRRQNDLRHAIEHGNESYVLDLVQSPQWPTLLQQSWGGTTPFRELIKYMPEVAKQVLDSCIVCNPDTPDPKNKDFEVVFDYSFVEDHHEKTQEHEEDGNARSSHEGFVIYPEDKKLAQQLRFEEVKNQSKTSFTTKYGPSFKKSKHPLALMVQHERLDLLTHPVISSLLHHKWFHFGLWGYLLNLVIYTIFLVFLTSFALVALNPRSTTCMQVLRNPGIAVCENGTEGINTTEEFMSISGSGSGSGMMSNDTTGQRNMTCVTCELSNTQSNFVFAGAVIIILFAVIRLLLEILQFFYEPISYLFNWVNYIEITLYILSISFVSVFRTTCLCPQEQQWLTGVMAILFGWIDLIIICAKSPSIGLYAIMFGRIVLTFVKVIILSVLLVIMFGVTFYMTFSEPQFQRSPFSRAFTMLKIMSMTAGDFSFDTVFRLSPSGESENAEEILFLDISYILWIIFVIIMPVLFTNMLVGLAVGDIQQIEKEAKLKKLALQVNVILTVEQMLRFAGIHKRFIRGRKSVKPNQKSSMYSDIDDTLLEEAEAEDEDHIFRCLLHCILGLFANCARCFVGCYYGLKEIKYQLWEGERYDTLENLEATLKSHLDKSEDQKDKMLSYITTKMSQQMKQIADDTENHIKEAKQEHTEALENVKQMVEKCMQALEELRAQKKAEMGNTKSYK